MWPRNAASQWLSAWRCIPASLHKSRQQELTLVARCGILLVAEILANAFAWVLCAILFTRHAADRGILSLALVAWTTGLRHGLDADHISAIDNATRRIVSVPRKAPNGQAVSGPRRPVTVGLFFSLGHSTIVVAVTIAIAVSADVANRLGGVGEVGSIVGAAVSGSFLVLIGCINTVILARTVSKLRRQKRETQRLPTNAESEPHAQFTGCMTRLAMPVLKAVDRPYKMYVVGVLFGLGFDTAGSIALLAVAAIGLQGLSTEPQQSKSDGRVVLLALLFTAGMTLVDSADSVLMIWAYAPEKTGSGRRRFALLREIYYDTSEDAPATASNVHASGNVKKALPTDELQTTQPVSQVNRKTSTDSERPYSTLHIMPAEIPPTAQTSTPQHGAPSPPTAPASSPTLQTSQHPPNAPNTQAPNKTPSATASTARAPPTTNLRHASAAALTAPATALALPLTALSIALAFAIGTIVLLGLIGDTCVRCTAAADRQESGGDGGLEGRWWLAWRRAGDASGYVGAGIVGVFGACVALWAFVAWMRRRRAR